jgi:hypothetical protein
LVVFVVRLAKVGMAATYAGEFQRRQRLFGRITGASFTRTGIHVARKRFNEVETGAEVTQ